MPGKVIFILYAGGTIGMEASASGYTPGDGLVSQIESWITVHAELSKHHYVMECADPPLDSANASPKDWFDLAAHIWAGRERADGFVILHGTDTLAYASSALSFLMIGFGKPIVLSGAMIPASVPGSDAKKNTLGAITCALESGIQEVAVYFDTKLMRGNRVRKSSTNGVDALLSPHWPALASLSDRLTVDLSAQLGSRAATRPQIHPYKGISVGLLKLYPGMPSEYISLAANMHPHGLVLELYGSGTGPGANGSMTAALQRATSSGTSIVGVSQCLAGRVDLAYYETGHALADSGVIGGHDLTAEAALTKLLYLRNLGLSYGQVQQEMIRSIAGELSA